MGGLVSSGMKFQTTPNHMDEIQV